MEKRHTYRHYYYEHRPARYRWSLAIVVGMIFVFAIEVAYVDAIIVSLLAGREECVTRKIGVGVDADIDGSSIIDFHIAIHPENVDSLEQNLSQWTGHIQIYLRDEATKAKDTFFTSPTKIDRTNRDLKDKTTIKTETVSLCMLHVNDHPSNANPDVIERVYVEHFDIDYIGRINTSHRNMPSGVNANFIRHAHVQELPFSKLNEDEKRVATAADYVFEGNKYYGEFEASLSSLRLRINELSEDLKLHHHFTMLSIDAANMRLKQVVRTTVIQYIIMVIITIAATFMITTFFNGESRSFDFSSLNPSARTIHA